MRDCGRGAGELSSHACHSPGTYERQSAGAGSAAASALGMNLRTDSGIQCHQLASGSLPRLSSLSDIGG